MNLPALHRRAFTLLETVMAAAIGSVVAITALGLFLTINKTDVMLGARYRQTASLERAHRVLSRAFMSLVTSEKPRPPQNRTTTRTGAGTGAATAGASGGPGSAGSGSLPASASGSRPGDPAPAAAADTKPEAPPPPPRLRLTTDPSMGARRMVRPGAQGFAGGPVQMFEIVVHTLPAGRAAPGRAVRTADVDESADEKDAEKSDRAGGEPPRLLSPTGKVYRGAFLLRPASSDAEQETQSGEPASWTLWWQPLPPAREDGRQPDAAEVAAAGAPVEVATEIAYWHWQAFDDRERKQEYTGTWRNDLPAYVEVELATTAGLWANWMFEVDWVDGAETGSSSDEEGTGTETTEENGSGATPTTPGARNSPTAPVTKMVPLKQ